MVACLYFGHFLANDVSGKGLSRGTQISSLQFVSPTTWECRQNGTGAKLVWRGEAGKRRLLFWPTTNPSLLEKISGRGFHEFSELSGLWNDDFSKPWPFVSREYQSVSHMPDDPLLGTHPFPKVSPGSVTHEFVQIKFVESEQRFELHLNDGDKKQVWNFSFTSCREMAPDISAFGVAQSNFDHLKIESDRAQGAAYVLNDGDQNFLVTASHVLKGTPIRKLWINDSVTEESIVSQLQIVWDNPEWDVVIVRLPSTLDKRLLHMRYESYLDCANEHWVVSSERMRGPFPVLRVNQEWMDVLGEPGPGTSGSPTIDSLGRWTGMSVAFQMGGVKSYFLRASKIWQLIHERPASRVHWNSKGLRSGTLANGATFEELPRFSVASGAPRNPVLSDPFADAGGGAADGGGGAADGDGRTLGHFDRLLVESLNWGDGVKLFFTFLHWPQNEFRNEWLLNSKVVEFPWSWTMAGWNSLLDEVAKQPQTNGFSASCSSPEFLVESFELQEGEMVSKGTRRFACGLKNSTLTLVELPSSDGGALTQVNLKIDSVQAELSWSLEGVSHHVHQKGSGWSRSVSVDQGKKPDVVFSMLPDTRDLQIVIRKGERLWLLLR